MTLKKYLLSGDFGKDTSKMVGKEINDSENNLKYVSFKTKLYNLKEGFVDVEGNSHKVTFENEEYIIGEQGQEKSYETTKTTLLHKLACYTSITQYLEPNTKNNEVYLALACPLSVLLNAEAKEEYKNFIKGDGEINIEVDGNDYTFTIKDVIIKAEGSGVLYTKPEWFVNKDVLLIDIGGLNMGINVYRNGVCKKEDRYPEECGNDELVRHVREQMSRYNKGNIISRETAEKILEDGYAMKYGKVDAKSIEFLDTAKKNYVKDILTNIKDKKLNLNDFAEVIFVGGTVQRVTDVIHQEIPHVKIAPNSQWSTVEGLYAVVYAKHGK